MHTIHGTDRRVSARLDLQCTNGDVRMFWSYGNMHMPLPSHGLDSATVVECAALNTEYSVLDTLAMHEWNIITNRECTNVIAVETSRLGSDLYIAWPELKISLRVA